MDSRTGDFGTAYGIKMYFDGAVTREQVKTIPCRTELSDEEIFEIINATLKQ